MLRSTGILIRNIAVLYVQADILHSILCPRAQGPAKLVQARVQELSPRIVQQTIDGEVKSIMTMSMVLVPELSHLKRYSSHNVHFLWPHYMGRLPILEN